MNYECQDSFDWGLLVSFISDIDVSPASTMKLEKKKSETGATIPDEKSSYQYNKRKKGAKV